MAVKYVFVTNDGAETDLDLGHYERFIDESLNKNSTGKIYWSVLHKERRGDFGGGTVGDIESQPFLESIRQFQHKVGRENAILIHVTLIPYLKASGEMKTKPTQASVKELQGMGIQPDIIVCRSEHPLDKGLRTRLHYSVMFRIKDPAASNGVSSLQRCTPKASLGRAAGYLTLAAVAKWTCKHGGIASRATVNIKWVDSENSI